jgi:hypothetical protein
MDWDRNINGQWDQRALKWNIYEGKNQNSRNNVGKREKA